MVKSRSFCKSLVAVAIVAATIAPASAVEAARTTDLISRGNGQRANNQSTVAATSANGRVIVFHSPANNLVPGDNNNREDIFLRNRTYGNTLLISRSRAGALGNGHSRNPSISADGRYVVFASSATNLVAGDANGPVADVFRLDRSTGTVNMVSGAGANGANGSSGEDTFSQSAVSDNGRFVAFASRATNLTGVTDQNSHQDMFLRDMQEKKTVLITKGTDGKAAGSSDQAEISGNGRYVVYESQAPNLVPGDTNGPDAFVYDRVSKTNTLVSVHPGGGHFGFTPSISRDGSVVAFDGLDAPGGTEFNGDIWAVHLRFSGGVPQPPVAGDLEVVSVSSSGTEANGNSGRPSVNADGSRVAFWSYADSLVANDTNDTSDVFLKVLGGSLARVSVSSSGAEGNGASPPSGGPVDLNDSGHTIVFSSFASNLFPSDTNNKADVFAHIR